MVKYLLALSLVFALLLAGCAGVLANNDNPNGTGNNLVSVGNNTSGVGNNDADANRRINTTGNGTVLVKAQNIVSGCGIEPPDGNTSACGVHYIAPHTGKVEVVAIDVAGVDLAVTSVRQLQQRKIYSLGMLDTDSNGEISFVLPAGEYVFSFTSGNQGVGTGSIKIEAGKLSRVEANFTMFVPGTLPH